MESHPRGARDHRRAAEAHAGAPVRPRAAGRRRLSYATGKGAQALSRAPRRGGEFRHRGEEKGGRRSAAPRWTAGRRWKAIATGGPSPEDSTSVMKSFYRRGRRRPRWTVHTVCVRFFTMEAGHACVTRSLQRHRYEPSFGPTWGSRLDDTGAKFFQRGVASGNSSDSCSPR